ncbi:hypothetical protein N9C56_12170 [Paracoccaceae bacterium]|nr:hypothetical protein [Paracoccaceae bacterium]
MTKAGSRNTTRIKLTEKLSIKKIAKLKKVLERLSRRKTVQNRQLKTVLGAEGYARYLDDYCEQTQLHDVLKDKPDEIIEYERRLKAATFAYNKADSKSQNGHRSVKKMFGASDTLFERLSEYLTEKMAGNGALKTWFDRPLATGAEDSFGLDPDSFPKIIISRSLNNKGGGYLVNKLTIREVKVDAVQRVLEELTAPEQEIVVDEIAQMARLKR